MAETIFQILQWAIPSGGIGAAIAWIANRRLRTVEEKKKVEDTYKQDVRHGECRACRTS